MWFLGGIPILAYPQSASTQGVAPVVSYLLITNTTNLLLSDGSSFMKLAGY